MKKKSLLFVARFSIIVLGDDCHLSYLTKLNYLKKEKRKKHRLVTHLHSCNQDPQKDIIMCVCVCESTIFGPNL
jgi:hypothetical protein